MFFILISSNYKIFDVLYNKYCAGTILADSNSIDASRNDNQFSPHHIDYMSVKTDVITYRLYALYLS